MQNTSNSYGYRIKFTSLPYQLEIISKIAAAINSRLSKHQHLPSYILICITIDFVVFTTDYDPFSNILLLSHAEKRISIQ